MLITSLNKNNHFLYSPTVPVISYDEAVAVIFELEHEIAHLDSCIGLAAPQIGISKSVAIIRHKGVSINLINPTLISGERETIHQREGCMSLPNRIFNVRRFQTIRIKNHIFWKNGEETLSLSENPNRMSIHHGSIPKDLNLQPVEAVYVYENDESVQGGIICMAVQHEMDHLLGKTLDQNQEAVEQLSVNIDSKWKVGRNDPCPCGATGLDGRPLKFKKCCLPKMT